MQRQHAEVSLIGYYSHYSTFNYFIDSQEVEHD